MVKFEILGWSKKKFCDFLHDFWAGKFFLKRIHIGVTFAGNRLRAFPKSENAFLTLIQGKRLYLVKRQCNKFEFSPENQLYSIFLCEKSIARIPEAWKRFLDPDSGNEIGVLKR
jgi:hypothetical protein